MKLSDGVVDSYDSLMSTVTPSNPRQLRPNVARQRPSADIGFEICAEWFNEYRFSAALDGTRGSWGIQLDAV